MRFGFAEIIIVIIGLIIATILPAALQVFLATRKNKLYGLIMPIGWGIIATLFSVIILINLLGMNILSGIAFFLGIFVVLNIPTIIFIVIYIICRKQLKKKDEINKMKFQDLG